MAKVNHCWADKYETLSEGLRFGSDEWAEVWLDTHPEPDGQGGVTGQSATCLLESGHTGPHQWTADDSIEVSFAPVVRH